MDRLDEIERDAFEHADWRTYKCLPEADFEWLISEVKRLRQQSEYWKERSQANERALHGLG